MGFRWRWKWDKYYGKYEITDLHPVCSKCDTPLVQDYAGYSPVYKCLRCGEIAFSDLPDLDDVKMLISDNVRRKYYPDD